MRWRVAAAGACLNWTMTSTGCPDEGAFRKREATSGATFRPQGVAASPSATFVCADPMPRPRRRKTVRAIIHSPKRAAGAVKPCLPFTTPCLIEGLQQPRLFGEVESLVPVQVEVQGQISFKSLIVSGLLERSRMSMQDKVSSDGRPDRGSIQRNCMEKRGLDQKWPSADSSSACRARTATASSDPKALPKFRQILVTDCH